MADDQFSHSQSQRQITSIAKWIEETEEHVPEAAISTMGSPVSRRSRASLLNSPCPESRSPTPSSSYRSLNYPTQMQLNANYYLTPLPAGLMPEDVDLCQRLLTTPLDPPSFADSRLSPSVVRDFLSMFLVNSEMRVMIELHPLLVPSAYYLQQVAPSSPEREWLRLIEDTYNESWPLSTPIVGPRPQPDHARGISLRALSRRQTEAYRLHWSAYGTHERCLFPYLTAEVKRASSASSSEAQHQNMHSMCIVMKCILQLGADAGHQQDLMRRILGFSISHDSRYVQIRAHYPDIDDEGNIAFFERELHSFDIATEPLTCQQFVRNLDRFFFPIHLQRIQKMLDTVEELERTAHAAEE